MAGTWVGRATPAGPWRARRARSAGAGLRVDLTLFDWWSDFADTTDNATWMADVLGRYRSDPELAFVELKNEPPVTQPVVAHWVAAELPVLRHLAGTVPVTVSLTTDPALTQLRALRALLAADPPSFYDLHVYGTPGAVAAELAAAEALVAPVPVYVGETGMSTLPGPGSDAALADARQAWYFRAVEWAVQQLGLPPAAPWTYTDFTPGTVPAGVTVAAAQLDFGLVTTSGAPKPAATVVERLFRDGTVGSGFNRGFSQGSDGLPAVWQPYCASQGILRWSATVGHDGPGAAELARTGGDATCWPSFRVEPVVGLTPTDRTFRATAYAEGTAATGTSMLQVAWFAAGGTLLGTAESSPLPDGTTGWTPLTVTAEAPAGAAYPEIVLASAHDRGAVWFDDVTWQPLP